MATEQKVQIVEQYTEKFKQAKSVYLADYTGLDVETVTAMRKLFRDADIEYKVLKNRLAKRSLNEAGIKELDPYLKGVTSFIIGYDDPVAPAKIIKDFNAKNERLKLKVVLFEGKIFEAEDAKKIAELPTREALLAKFVGVLQAPMTKLAGTLGAPMQKLAGLLESLKDKK